MRRKSGEKVALTVGGVVSMQIPYSFAALCVLRREFVNCMMRLSKRKGSCFGKKSTSSRKNTKSECLKKSMVKKSETIFPRNHFNSCDGRHVSSSAVVAAGRVKRLLKLCKC